MWHKKFDKCSRCKNTTAKYEAKGLCVRCYNHLRNQKPLIRAKNLLAAKNNYKLKDKEYSMPVQGFKTKVANILDNFKRVKILQKEWKRLNYIKNKDYIYIQTKVNRRKRKGLPCLSIIIKGKEVFLPFEGFERPNCTTKTKELELYHSRVKDLKIVQEHFSNK